MMFSQIFGYPMIQSSWRIHTWVPGKHFPGCSPMSCNCSCSVSLACSSPFLVFSPYWQTSELNPYPLLLYLHSFLLWSHPGLWLSMPSIPSSLPSFDIQLRLQSLLSLFMWKHKWISNKHYISIIQKMNLFHFSQSNSVGCHLSSHQPFRYSLKNIGVRGIPGGSVLPI